MQRSLLIFMLLLTALVTYAQQIPVGSCGIVNIYDAAGNRTKRMYFCNNGTDPYPHSRGIVPSQQKTVFSKATDSLEAVDMEFQATDALYPNPTTGKFSVVFSKPVDNSTIVILDVSGKIIRQVKAGGYSVEFDLSGNAAGIYYVRIEHEGNTITKKVVKQ